MASGDPQEIRLPADCCFQAKLTKPLLQELVNQINQYPTVYDEVFTEIGQSIGKRGFLTKTDISALAAWKRLNLSSTWAQELQNRSNASLETDSRPLFDGSLATTDRIKRFAISGIPGFSTGTFAVASTVLSAWDPQEFAITDRRSREYLRTLNCGCGTRTNRYSVFLAHVHSARLAATEWGFELLSDSRSIDKAFFLLGSQSQVMRTL